MPTREEWQRLQDIDEAIADEARDYTLGNEEKARSTAKKVRDTFEDYLTQNVVEPASRAGYESAGAAAATIPMTAFDAIYPPSDIPMLPTVGKISGVGRKYMGDPRKNVAKEVKNLNRTVYGDTRKAELENIADRERGSLGSSYGQWYDVKWPISNTSEKIPRHYLIKAHEIGHSMDVNPTELADKAYLNVASDNISAIRSIVEYLRRAGYGEHELKRTEILSTGNDLRRMGQKEAGILLKDPSGESQKGIKRFMNQMDKSMTDVNRELNKPKLKEPTQMSDLNRGLEDYLNILMGNKPRNK